jgi:molecular chaperone DnaK
MSKLKALAEGVKIELSRSETSIMAIESFGAPMVDDDGREIEVDVSISRERYEAAISGLVARAVALTRDLVRRNPAAGAEAILMVGGPTLTPMLRREVGDAVGVRVDTSANPMTVVAEGAALYAANQPSRSVAAPAPMIGATHVVLDYRSVSDGDSVLVGGRLPDDVATLEFSAADGTWSSGQLRVNDGKFMVHLPMPRKGLHVFGLVARSAAGALMRTDPPSISVTRGITASAAPLSRPLGVVYEEGSESRVKTIIAKGTPLPARGTYDFRTTIALEPGGEIEIIRIHVVEGDSERPERNRNVGEIIITDEMVNRRVPAGVPVEVSVEVDESRLIRAHAYLSLVDKTFEAEWRSGAEDTDPAMLDELVEAERERMSEVAAHVSSTATREIHEELRAVERNLAVARAGDPDAGLVAFRELQAVQSRLDGLEKAQELPKAVAEAREESEMASGVVMEFGDEGHRARLQALIRDLDEAVNRNALSEIRRAGDKLSRLRFELLVRQPGWWLGYFRYLSEDVRGWTDNARAQQLLREGRAQIVREDFPALQATTRELGGLVRPDERSKASAFRNVGISM